MALSKGIAPPTSTLSWSNNYPLYSTNIATPTGRAMASGSVAVLITALEGYMSGNGATRSVRLRLGAAATAYFNVSASSSAQYTGTKPCSAYLVAGGVVTFYYDSNGATFFGRGGSGTVNDNVGGAGWSGTLAGAMYYVQAPTAPRTPSVEPGSDSATLSWVAPIDDGDSALQGYRIEYSTAANFAGAIASNVGTATTQVIAGLTPGATYYFRVAARNAVTTAAASWSVWSGTVSATLGAAPDAPGTPVLAVVGNAVEAAWSAPANTNGAPLIDYTLEYGTAADFTGAASVVVPASVTRTTVPGLTPSTTYYFRVKARNSIGTSAASLSASIATKARGALDLVRGASVSVGKTQVSIRSDAANVPTLTLGYTLFGTGTAFAAIAVVPTDAGAGTFSTKGGARALALTADTAGNLYVVGTDAADPNAVLVKRYAKTGTTSWAAAGALSQALASMGDPLAQFAAAHVPGTGTSPVATLIVLARRAGTVGVGGLSYATINLANVAASAGSLFLNYGNNPTWLAAPPVGAPHNSGMLDVAPLVAGGTRVAILADGYAVVDVANGAVVGVSKSASGTTVPGTWARVLGVNANTYVTLTVIGGALAWAFYGTSGTVLGSGTHAGVNAQGGAFVDQWDAYPNRATGQLVAYYVANSDARTVKSISISPTTYAAAAAVTVTAALGAVSSINGALRVPEGAPVDERRVVIESANDLTGALSVAAYSDRTGNQSPSAPTTVGVDGFDASFAHAFAWAFGDPNPLDTQSAYELQIQRVSDSIDVVSTGKVVSAAQDLTVTAGSLANGIDYRWRARTYDELDIVGAWSAYDAFTTSALGALTITSPATDNPAGVDTSSYPVAWTYAQGDGYTQTQRRVRVLQGGAVLSDTTMQATTAQSYTATALPSDVQLTIEVSIITNAPGTPTVTATRLLTTAYSSPMTPELALTAGESYVAVTVTNPTPTGARPEVIRNYIERRPSGAGNYTHIATVQKDGVYLDHAVASGVLYDYQVRGIT